MFAKQNLIGPGQRRPESERRRRSPALVTERLETRALLTIGDITTVAGDGTFGYSGTDGPATKAELNDPTGGTLGYAGDDGPATSASLDDPWDVALDSSGDIFVADSGNNVLRDVVTNPDATSTSLASSNNPTPYAFALLTFTATVTDSSNPGKTPSGAVQFVIDGTAYGAPVALVNGQASIGGQSLAAGTHSILAIFDPGSTAFVTSTSSPLSQTVNPGLTLLTMWVSDGPAVDPPNLYFTSATAVYGEPVSITADVSPTYGDSPTGNKPTGTITFFDGGTLLGTLSMNGASYLTLTTSSLPPGTHSITASYSGSPGFASSTSVQAATVTVTKASTDVVILSTTGKQAKGGFLIRIQIEITAIAPGAGIPTGTVSLKTPPQKHKKPKALATATLSGGKATLIDKHGRKGINVFNIFYSGDAGFEARVLMPTITFKTG